MKPDSTQAPRNCDYTAAFLILRLFLGLRALFAGLEKFESGGRYTFEAYYQNMTRMATGITGASFLPLWATKPFALSLGYILLVLGVTLLLGLKTRASLVLMGLVYVGLSFGLMVVQETEGVAWLAIHVALVAGALVLVRHNRFALWPDKMTEPATPPPPAFTRRDFLSTSLKLGAAAIMAPHVLRAAADGSAQLNVGLIGCGAQGRVLLNAALKIPGIRFKAVCDIWPYNRNYGANLLKKFGHDPKPFEDYREMLSAVPEIDAVIVATPDFMHAEHTNACLRAGKNVYCEKLMANTVENARSMVRTARETGKLLQIGHQRRSNPRYLHALGKVVQEGKLLGRLTNCSGQWNRAVSADLGWPERYALPEAALQKYGYANMHEFMNWRWFKKYAGGPISDLGAHQIDIFNWFLGVNPASVIASGGADYYTTHEWYDNVFAVYEFNTPAGPVRSQYQVLTTTSAGGGYHEYFMGDEGALKMSENPKYTKLYREARAPEWDQWVDQGFVSRPGAGEEGAAAPAKPWEKENKPKFAMAAPRASVVDVRETAALSAWNIPVTLDKAIHQPHLENFFDAIRGKATLNCPGEMAFASAVTVLKVNEAVAAQKMLKFAPEDFVA